jgi:hypothetical protein
MNMSEERQAIKAPTTGIIKCPRTFHQLLLFVIDESIITLSNLAQHNVAHVCPKEILGTVIGAIKKTGVGHNQSLAVIYYGNNTRIDQPVISLLEVEDTDQHFNNRRHNPSIAEGLKYAEIISKNFLSEEEEVRKSVNIIIISSRIKTDDAEAIMIANRLKNNDYIRISTYYVKINGENVIDSSESVSFLTKISSPNSLVLEFSLENLGIEPFASEAQNKSRMVKERINYNNINKLNL